MTFEELDLNTVYIFIKDRDPKDPGKNGAAYIITREEQFEKKCVQFAFDETRWGNPPFLFPNDRIIPHEGLLEVLRKPNKKEKEFLIRTLFDSRLKIIEE